MEIIFHKLKTFVKTLTCFLIACFFLPLILLSFVCMYFTDELVNYVLSTKYPSLTISKSKKIRSLIDTPRNAGIFHFLLEVKGLCDFEKIKRYYADNLTGMRDRAGFLRFPKLRQKLVTCWGHYAWVNDHSAFNINNHVVLNSRYYRGRPVSDKNIQEFISDLVTKYIPSDLPQWQVIIIPASPDTSDQLHEGPTLLNNHYYILIKIHHLIIAEEEDLRVSELLMLRENEGKQSIEDNEFSNVSKQQALLFFAYEPVYIKKLLSHIWKSIVNYWKAFIYEFESLETPDGYRPVHITNVTQLLSVLLIITVNVCIDYWRTMSLRNKLRKRHRFRKNNYSRIEIIQRLLFKEINQRNLSWLTAYNAISTSFHPASIAKAWMKFLWKANINNFLLMPYYIYCEIVAIGDIIFKGQVSNTSTCFGKLSFYLPMWFHAQVEFCKICYEIFKAPANIFEELFLSTSNEPNFLQKKTFSGRKIVSFSKSINSENLKERIKFNDQVRESEFVLTCLAGALYNYLHYYSKSTPVPRIVNTTCRTIEKGYFTDTLGSKTEHIGGVVFLKLPLKTPGYEHTKYMHSIVDNIRRKQIMIYLASLGQTRFDFLTALIPRVLAKVFINFFSHNFPVSITEIYGSTSNFQTLWGHEVEDVLLFRPPQSKTCLSLNIHRFGTKYRLAIMADTQLGPDHSRISRLFEEYMESTTF